MKYKGYYVSCICDCDENLNGYYCEIYKDNDEEEMVDYFCVHEDELRKDDLETLMKKNVDIYDKWERENNGN